MGTRGRGVTGDSVKAAGYQTRGSRRGMYHRGIRRSCRVDAGKTRSGRRRHCRSCHAAVLADDGAHGIFAAVALVMPMRLRPPLANVPHLRRPLTHPAAAAPPISAPRSVSRATSRVTTARRPSLFTHPLAAMASVFHAFPQLRTAAPRLSRRLFVCRPCLNARPPVRSLFAAARSCALRPSPTQSVRWKSTQPLRSSATIGASNSEAAILADAVNGERTKSKSYPNISSKSVAYWLLGSAASVFGIVVFGGLTRLTESG
jgi:hypothetical protein